MKKKQIRTRYVPDPEKTPKKSAVNKPTKKLSLKYVGFSLIFLFILIGFLFYTFDIFGITGKVSFGNVGLTILAPQLGIAIDSPGNTTYNFTTGDNYAIEINVSATYDLGISAWWYTLEDLTSNQTINDSIIFTPNTTINAVRFSNNLTIYANDTSNNINSTSVVFYVYVPNVAPIIRDIGSQIIACEDTSFSYEFNATDQDGDNLTTSISPSNPFYLTSATRINSTDLSATIYSGTLGKSDLGSYDEVVSVNDNFNATCCVDSENTNITVVEINNPPSLANIGVQTVYTQGDNASFYKELQITDTESGNRSSGNFTFNLTFLSGGKFFDITPLGIMNFTANDSIVNVHNISICTTDLSLPNPHQNISSCGQDGLNQTTCKNFSLTVTNNNRNPTITTNYPSNLTQASSGASTISFNISEYDPDGTIPDTYWYVDNVFQELDTGSSNDEFDYSFGCGVSGEHTVSVIITDGLVNDTIEWTIAVEESSCSVDGSEGGGGGGTSIYTCNIKWTCNPWEVCQDTKKSLEVGVLTGDDYRLVDNDCSENNWNDNVCGFQIRRCFDINNCNLTIKKPLEMQGCHFTVNPNCNDNIKNCHDGDCELLIDCGGPCNKCPTCSDNKQNQGEEDVDCGGPCPWKCSSEKPLADVLTKDTFKIIIYITILFVLMFLIITKVMRVVHLGVRLGGAKRRRKSKKK
ncbi:hypothetical protein CMI40_02600 [Candidatus Pacearchaeota archaeon]|jgi:hypothetical protein|nr:hypothetical protein [Candidatus Pacearchaeota archaeon]|tara:strand:+ start:5479 stop:7557 length:2079 start_codon:yes stop_codon:yes gene_type:complete